MVLGSDRGRGRGREREGGIEDDRGNDSMRDKRRNRGRERRRNLYS